MKKFILPENHQGNTLLGHVFTDGVLFASDDDAKKLEKVLCRYYGVRMESVEAADSGSEELEPNPSLSVTSTKNGQSTEDGSD